MGNIDILLNELIRETRDMHSTLQALLAAQGNNNNSGSAGNNNNQAQKKTVDELIKSFSSGTKLFINDLARVGSAFTNVDSKTGVSGFLNSIGGLSSTVGTLIPELGILFDGVTATAEILEYTWDMLNKNLDAYRNLNANGVALSGGMQKLGASAAYANLSTGAFGQILQNNTDVVAGLSSEYEDAVDTIGAFIGSVNQAQSQMGIYGLSQEQVADLTMKYTKALKIQQALNPSQLQNAEMTERTANYIQNLTALSKVTGQTVDALMKRNMDQLDKVDSSVMISQLNEIMGAEEGQKAFEGFNSMFNSLGEAGDIMRDQFTDYFTTNRLSDEFAQFTDIGSFFSRMKKNIIEGGTTTEAGMVDMLTEFQNFSQSADFKNGLELAVIKDKEIGNKMAKFANKLALIDPEAAIKENIAGPWERFTTNLGLAWNRTAQDITAKWNIFLDKFGTGLDQPLDQYLKGQISIGDMFSKWMGNTVDLISTYFDGTGIVDAIKSGTLGTVVIDWVSGTIDSLKKFLLDTKIDGKSIMRKAGDMVGTGLLWIGAEIRNLLVNHSGDILAGVVNLGGMLFKGIFDFLGGIAQTTIMALTGYDITSGLEDVGGFIDFILDGFVYYARRIGDAIGKLFSGDISGYMDIYESIIHDMWKLIGIDTHKISDKLTGMVTSVKDAIAEAIDGLVKFFSEKFTVSNLIPGGMLFNAAKEQMPGFKDAAVNMWDDLWSSDDNAPLTTKESTPKLSPSVNWGTFGMQKPTDVALPTKITPPIASLIPEYVQETRRQEQVDPTGQPTMDKRSIEVLTAILNSMRGLSDVMSEVKDHTNKVANNTEPLTNV